MMRSKGNKELGWAVQIDFKEISCKYMPRDPFEDEQLTTREWACKQMKQVCEMEEASPELQKRARGCYRIFNEQVRPQMKRCMKKLATRYKLQGLVKCTNGQRGLQFQKALKANPQMDVLRCCKDWYKATKGEWSMRAEACRERGQEFNWKDLEEEDWRNPLDTSTFKPLKFDKDFLKAVHDTHKAWTSVQTRHPGFLHPDCANNPVSELILEVRKGMAPMAADQD